MLTELLIAAGGLFTAAAAFWGGRATAKRNEAEARLVEVQADLQSLEFYRAQKTDVLAEVVRLKSDVQSLRSEVERLGTQLGEQRNAYERRLHELHEYHASEMARLEERHAAELFRIKDEHGRELAGLRESNRGDLTEALHRAAEGISNQKGDSQ